ncbi:MAG: hypothetical protein LBB34_00585 [Holosporales bacterium]|jgi:hypothetical protein|nr:hypothetical protein [Holosporales bacterium]
MIFALLLTAPKIANCANEHIMRGGLGTCATKKMFKFSHISSLSKVPQRNRPNFWNRTGRLPQHRMQSIIPSLRVTPLIITPAKKPDPSRFTIPLPLPLSKRAKEDVDSRKESTLAPVILPSSADVSGPMTPSSRVVDKITWGSILGVPTEMAEAFAVYMSFEMYPEVALYSALVNGTDPIVAYLLLRASVRFWPTPLWNCNYLLQAAIGSKEILTSGSPIPYGVNNEPNVAQLRMLLVVLSYVSADELDSFEIMVEQDEQIHNRCKLGLFAFDEQRNLVPPYQIKGILTYALAGGASSHVLTILRNRGASIPICYTLSPLASKCLLEASKIKIMELSLPSSPRIDEVSAWKEIVREEAKRRIANEGICGETQTKEFLLRVLECLINNLSAVAE